MDDFRLTLTYGPDYDEDDAEQLLETAIDFTPEFGPVASLDRSTGAVSLTVAFGAEDAERAVPYATGVIASVFRLAGIERRKVIGIEVELVDRDRAGVP